MENQPLQTAALSQFCADVAGCHLSERTYFACANFLFYTSCYEEWLFTACRQQNPSNTEVVANEMAAQIDLKPYDIYADHYCQRYLSENSVTPPFHRLGLSPLHAGRVEVALREFQSHKVRDQHLLWACLMIAYRFRNNMFHGNKKMANLNCYATEFELLNRFWDQFLRDIVKVGYVGFHSKPRNRRENQ